MILDLVLEDMSHVADGLNSRIPEAAPGVEQQDFTKSIFDFQDSTTTIPPAVPNPLHPSFTVHGCGLYFSLRELSPSYLFNVGLKMGAIDFERLCEELSPSKYLNYDIVDRLGGWRAALDHSEELNGRLKPDEIADLVDGFRTQQLLAGFLSRCTLRLGGSCNSRLWQWFDRLVHDTDTMRNCLPVGLRLPSHCMPDAERIGMYPRVPAIMQALCRRLLFWHYQEIFFLRQEIWASIHLKPMEFQRWYHRQGFSVQSCWFDSEVHREVQKATRVAKGRLFKVCINPILV